MNCEQCGTSLGIRRHHHARFCYACLDARRKDQRIQAAERYRQRFPNVYRAHSIIRRAIRRGELPLLDGSIRCVDCAGPAHHYDHRDYSKPLDVEPVCLTCNLNRPPGINRISDFEFVFLRVLHGPHREVRS